MREYKFNYREVSSLLCQACSLRVPDVFDCDSNKFYHVINGERITCTANTWRTSGKVHELLATKEEK